MEEKYSLSELKRAYNKALKDSKDRFDFHGKIFLCAYAKYLIEYLENRYKQKGLRETEKTVVFYS
jgi:uncharacterized protein YajQ (UPF0234 family)